MVGASTDRDMKRSPAQGASVCNQQHEVTYRQPPVKKRHLLDSIECALLAQLIHHLRRSSTIEAAYFDHQLVITGFKNW
jgi:hypothetical protein